MGETIWLRREVNLKQNWMTISAFEPARWIMWWVLSIGVVLTTGPLVDIVEEWRANRCARNDLSRMRLHESVGHSSDSVRRQWLG